MFFNIIPSPKRVSHELLIPLLCQFAEEGAHQDLVHGGPGGLVVRIWSFHCGGLGSTPGPAIIPCATQCGQNTKKKFLIKKRVMWGKKKHLVHPLSCVSHKGSSSHLHVQTHSQWGTLCQKGAS